MATHKYNCASRDTERVFKTKQILKQPYGIKNDKHIDVEKIAVPHLWELFIDFYMSGKLHWEQYRGE